MSCCRLALLRYYATPDNWSLSAANRQGFCKRATATGLCVPPVPLPWTLDDNGACFIVKDRNGQALAYVCFEDEAG
jgi:hypothetical protein